MYYCIRVEKAYVNQRKLETEAKQLQVHVGEVIHVHRWIANMY